MRHRKHRNQLGVKKEHRSALLANLSSALITHGRIVTTLKKAKALRPFVEKVITQAKKGALSNRRIALSRVRDAEAVHLLFDEKADQFKNRNGGYTRIYKLGPRRRGDAAEMAIIELIDADDEGYAKKSKPKAKKKAKKPEEPAGAETSKDEAEAAPKSEEEAEAPEAKAEAPESEVETPEAEAEAKPEEKEKKEDSPAE